MNNINQDKNHNNIEETANFDSHELAAAFFNWRYAEDEADPFPVMNAIVKALENDTQIVFPFIVMDEDYTPIPKEELEGVDIFETYNSDQIVIPVLDSGNGDHWVPIFTSEEEMKKGEDTFFMYVSLTAAWDMIMSDVGCEGVVFNPWSDNIPLDKNNMKETMDHDAQSHVSIILGDITKLHVDAIVNAANNSLRGGGGVDGAIHRAAGPKLLDECIRLNGCDTGDAKMTKGYRLPADYVIHTVGPIYSAKHKQECGELLMSCYRRCLDLAYEKGCSSIAFPSISTGAYGYPLNEAVPIALITISDWLAEHADEVIDVYCCCYSRQDYETYWDFMEALAPQMDYETLEEQE